MKLFKKVASVIILFSALAWVLLPLEKTQEPGMRVVSSENGEIELQIPAGWRQMNTLHLHAELQVARLRDEMYLVVINDETDPKTTNIADQNLINVENLTKSLSNPQISATQMVGVAGKPALLTEIRAFFNNHEVFYLHLTLKGEHTYYRMLAWTLEKKSQENMPIIAKVMHSFKEKPL